MAVQDDTQAARRELAALERTVAVLARHYGDTVDVRRLRADVDRVAEDVDLLCGRHAPAAPDQGPERQVIDDSAYAHDFWMDAADEGLGGSRHRDR